MDIQVDRQGKVTVRCRFFNLDFHNDYYTVIYSGDYQNGKSDKRYQNMMQGTDAYVFDKYSPPNSAMIVFNGIILSLALFAIPLFN